MKEMEELLEIMDTLRGENGCNWDKKQTHDSLIPFLLEEAHEVIDTLEKKDFPHLKEELGDLLFQIVFHARLAKEEGHFVFTDIVKELSDKLIRRHPHIFQTQNHLSAEEVLTNWEKIKAREKETKGIQVESALDGIPKSYSSVLKAEALQKKASKVGFDWGNESEVLAKITEEIKELEFELNHPERSMEKIEDELGDVFFSIVNLSRFLKISPELALQRANQKFEKRFRAMEKLASTESRSLEQLNLQQMDELWEKVKSKEKES
jgi:MazG family protein